MRYMIIYQKHNGELLYRFNKNKPYYKKGDTTSMGWKVVDIRRMYKGNLLTLSDYRTKIDFKSKIRHYIYLFQKSEFYKLIQIVLIYIIFVNLKKL